VGFVDLLRLKGISGLKSIDEVGDGLSFIVWQLSRTEWEFTMKLSRVFFTLLLFFPKVLGHPPIAGRAEGRR
jgi:hypothetical protein